MDGDIKLQDDHVFVDGHTLSVRTQKVQFDGSIEDLDVTRLKAREVTAENHLAVWGDAAVAKDANVRQVVRIEDGHLAVGHGRMTVELVVVPAGAAAAAGAAAPADTPPGHASDLIRRGATLRIGPNELRIAAPGTASSVLANPPQLVRREVYVPPNAVDQTLLDVPDPCSTGSEPYPKSGSGNDTRNPGIDSLPKLHAKMSQLVDDFVAFVHGLDWTTEAAFVGSVKAELVKWSKDVSSLADALGLELPAGDAYQSPGMNPKRAEKLAKCLFKALTASTKLDDADRDALVRGLVLGLQKNLQLNTSGYPAVTINSDVIINGNAYVAGKIYHQGQVETPFSNWLDMAARIVGWQTDNALALLDQQQDSVLDELRRLAALLERMGRLDKINIFDPLTWPPGTPPDPGPPIEDDPGAFGGPGRWILESLRRKATDQGAPRGNLSDVDRRSASERVLDGLLHPVLDRALGDTPAEEWLTVLAGRSSDAGSVAGGVRDPILRGRMDRLGLDAELSTRLVEAAAQPGTVRRSLPFSLAELTRTARALNERESAGINIPTVNDAGAEWRLWGAIESWVSRPRG
jgi:hypothetical protein